MSEDNFETARLVVRLDAVTANYRTFVRRAGPAAVAGVVKADAYGLGATQIAKTLSGQGCETFFVARISEGIALRPVLPDARIFVLDGAHPGAVPALIGHRLTPVLNSLEEIALWANAAREYRTQLDAAVQIDTGMSRLGLSGSALSTLAQNAKWQLHDLRVVLWMSHLACANDAESAMNAQQLDRFRTALAILPSAPASLASSGGVLLGKDYVFDMVRPGIGLYGGNPHEGHENPFAVAAVLTARILQLRRIDAGHCVGYGATWRASRPARLATVGAGYADGLFRTLGNRGGAAIAGIRVPIVGRVSMDLITLDVSAVSEAVCQTGAEVEFFGDSVSLEDVAKAASTANYEILTSVSARVPRQYEDEAVA